MQPQPRDRGVETELDERMILHTLRNVGTDMQATDMHAVCSMVLIACYDRQVEREFFFDVLRLCNEMYTDTVMMDRAVILQQAIALLDKRQQLHPEAKTEMPGGKRALPEQLQAGFEMAHRSYTRKRLQLADMVELLTECPSSLDMIS